jgi:hypothetical protein
MMIGRSISVRTYSYVLMARELVVVKLCEVKKLIRSFAGSHPSEAYNKDLMDDDALKKKSVLVPDDIKDKIRKWAKSMGLTSKRT